MSIYADLAIADGISRARSKSSVAGALLGHFRATGGGGHSRHTYEVVTLLEWLRKPRQIKLAAVYLFAVLLILRTLNAF